jgi:hypothetical protein
MPDPVLTYFSENLAAISKEELLQALKNAVRSADYWREACLGCFSPKSHVGIESNLHDANDKGVQVSAKV